jgi:hypothetical protein
VTDQWDVRQMDGEPYRQLALKLLEIARQRELPNPRRELLSLPRQYERRADLLQRQRG